MRGNVTGSGRAFRVLGVACALATLAAPAGAQSPEQARKGFQLADRYCAGCHVIVRDGPAGWTDAPSFAAIADRPGVTAAWIEGVVMQPHLHMLNLPRGRADARVLAAYILSLRQR